jgi:hypothetical protein
MVYLIVAHDPDDVHPHPHCHIVCSGTNIWGEALNLNNAEFKNLKQRAEAYQRDRWPEYKHSKVEHGKGSKSRQPEYWIKKRDRAVYKDTLARTLERILSDVKSFDDFVKRIEHAGLVPWRDRRTGKVVGITFSGKNHRFRTLGISRERLRELERDRTRERSYGRGL